MSSFASRLQAAWDRAQSLICVGLDPDPALMPVDDVAAFSQAIVDATCDLVCAYKPNMAFFEALGVEGLQALAQTVKHIRRVAPHVVVIADGKRGDVAPSSAFYARALFDTWGMDAATVNWYGGQDALSPFLDRDDKGVFIWCRSSNPGASEFQDVAVEADGVRLPLYQWVARRARGWDRAGNVGLVVGATYPRELEEVRALCPRMPLLVPGVGAQGGSLAAAAAGLDASGRNLIISASRSVLYASASRTAFTAAARDAAASLRQQVNAELARRGQGWPRS